MHTKFWVLYTTQNTLHIALALRTLHTEQCTLHTTQGTLHTAHCILHTSHYTVHTAPCTLWRQCDSSPRVFSSCSYCLSSILDKTKQIAALQSPKLLSAIRPTKQIKLQFARLQTDMTEPSSRRKRPALKIDWRKLGQALQVITGRPTGYILQTRCNRSCSTN